MLFLIDPVLKTTKGPWVTAFLQGYAEKPRLGFPASFYPMEFPRDP
jgi:hypothetical protein